MKTLKLNILAVLAIALLFTACQEDEPEIYAGSPFFRFPIEEDGTNIYVQQHYQNFRYYIDEAITRDTIFIPVNAVAAIPQNDVRIHLEAFDSDTLTYPERIQSGAVNANPGVQYVSFDSEELDDLLTFQAGRMRDTIGIVVLREESMKSVTYKLTFRIANSEGAYVADGNENRVVVYTTDRLSQPSNWDKLQFGTYGDVKLDFMIRHSDLVWDYDDVERITSDEFLRGYYLYKFQQDLIKENEELGDEGPLQEADGTFVNFSLY